MTYEEIAKEIIENGFYESVVELMDDEIREQLHMELAPCTDAEFMTAYLEAHENKYQMAFEI